MDLNFQVLFVLHDRLCVCDYFFFPLPTRAHVGIGDSARVLALLHCDWRRHETFFFKKILKLFFVFFLFFFFVYSVLIILRLFFGFS